jgi:hypothetical protein
MLDHAPDNRDICRACRQVWPCRVDKLRAMATQTASPHEAEIARRKLATMGAPIRRPPPRQSPPTPPPHQQTMNDFLNDLWGEQIFRSRRRYRDPFAEAAQRYAEAQAHVAEEVKRQAEEMRRAQAATIPPCPGCGHPEKEHVIWRCYQCHPNYRIEAAERRAAICGWAWLRTQGGQSSWMKVRSDWRTGPIMGTSG